MNFIRRIGCLFGFHRHSKRRAKMHGYVLYSRCTYCNVRMRQRGNKDWVVERGT